MEIKCVSVASLVPIYAPGKAENLLIIVAITCCGSYLYLFTLSFVCAVFFFFFIFAWRKPQSPAGMGSKSNSFLYIVKNNFLSLLVVDVVVMSVGNSEVPPEWVVKINTFLYTVKDLLPALLIVSLLRTRVFLCCINYSSLFSVGKTQCRPNGFNTWSDAANRGVATEN
jgi:hypothetical protein